VAAVVAMLLATGAVVAAAAQEHNITPTSALSQRAGATNGQDGAQPSPTTSQQPAAGCSSDESDVSRQCEGVDETGPDEPDGDNTQHDDQEASGPNDQQGAADHAMGSQKRNHPDHDQ
jgi:transposase-like protein